MNKKGSVIKKSKFWAYEIKTRWGTSTVYSNYDPWEVYYNLWDLADKILEAGEITEELFERIGVVLAMKSWFWKSLKVGR